MARPANQLRIVAGQWRGRKVHFCAVPGLRPTPDRVRETLFNWLAPRLPGAACLDLFAGSGALGFEAASRGAGQVVMVECKATVAQCLRDNRQRLGADMVEVVERDAVAFLRSAPRAYEIVFLDPPFAARDTLRAAMQQLTESGTLAAGARIYVEVPASEPPPVAPAGWKLLKSKRAGQVAFQLYGYADE